MYHVAALMLAASIALLAYDRYRNSAPRFSPGDRVALFGDSLAQGLRGPLKKLADSSGVDMVSDVQQGTRMDQWIQRGPQVAAGCKYALISLGTNDSAANANHQDQMARYAKDISASLHGMGVKPIWILPPRMRFSTDLANKAIAETGDAVLVSADYPRYDGIHPTPAAFGQWASDIWAAVGPRLASAPAFPARKKSLIVPTPPIWNRAIGQVCRGKIGFLVEPALFDVDPFHVGADEL